MAGARAKAAKAKRQWDEIEAAFNAVRSAMLEQLVGTHQASSLERERLYQGVQVLDALKLQIFGVVDASKIEEAAEEIAKSLAPGATH